MELLRIHINITETISLTDEDATINMILFDGHCDSNLFQGDILPGGVDTQKLNPDGSGTLSARYILQGKDNMGNACKLFIENNAYVSPSSGTITHPTIYTDSPCLKWLEKADLYGNILSGQEQLIITINGNYEAKELSQNNLPNQQ